MILNDEQIQELIDIVEFNNSLFICTNIGSDCLTLSEKSILTRRGIDWRKYTDSYIDFAYKFGMIAESVRNKKKVSELTFQQLKKFISSGKFQPLSEQEKYTLNIVKKQCYKDVTNLKNNIVNDLYQITVDLSNKDRYSKILKESSKQVVNGRLSVKEFSKLLSNKTQDWQHDFDRVADYIMHSSYQHGKANELLKNYGVDVKVWYRVHKDACKHCKKIYLEKDQLTPKVFKLIDVINNGSNIGVKSENYKPTVYSLHPWCRCELEQAVENGVWNIQKQKFEILRNNYGVNRKSKIKITVNGK